MNNIILQMVHQKIMGSIIDAIEYFLMSYKFNKNIFLVFCYGLDIIDNNYLLKIKNIIFEKYINFDMSCLNNIKIIKKNDLLNNKFNKVLILDWGTITRIKGLLRAKKILIISELTDKSEYFLNPNKYPVVYYGEMPFVYKNFNYRMKFAFDFYPEINNSQSFIYVNSPENKNILNDTNILKIAKLKNKKILYKSHSHKEKLFSLFDTYLYYHNNTYFDPHPRLFHECFFYNKEIIYKNPYNIIDGSYYRYNDLLKTGLTNRKLNEDDIILQELINL